MKRTTVFLMFMALISPMARCATVTLDLRKGDGVQTENRPKLAAAAMRSALSSEEGVLQREELPAGSARVSALNVGDVLSLRLFADVDLELSLTRQCESPLGGRSFLAEVAGYDGIKNAVVCETADGLQIDVQDYKNGKVYSVFSGANGVVVKEINPNAGIVTPTAPLEPLLPEPSQTSPKRTVMSAVQQSSTCVDILVAFDRNACAWAGAQGGGITNFATVTVQKMNTAIGNTGLDGSFRFRLVGVMAVDAETDDLNEALDAVTKGTGAWSGVKSMRDAVGADLVTTLIDTGSAYGTTGLGWGLRTTSFANFSEYGYNVCSVRAAAQSHVVTHECGHNMGAGHSDQQADSPGPQLYSYSSGYYFNVGSTSYHTIMAYNSDGYSSTTYQPVPFFSSPDYSYSGVTVGNATHDNTKTLAQTFSGVSNWRSQVVPESYDVFFTPESGTSFKNSISVTLKPGKDGVAVRYTTDGTEPTASSSLYAGTALTLTQTTTVKARTVVGGALGPVFQATYYKESLGMALNAPQYEWTTGSDCPWQYETTNTYDGAHALVAIVPAGQTAWVKTTVTGPKYVTLQRYMRGNPQLSVLSDGETIYSESWGGYSLAYAECSCRIPDGTHEFTIRLKSSYGTTSAFIDAVTFYDADPPVFSPTGTSSSPCEFEKSTLVTLSHPIAGAKMFYTLDGTDPTTEKAIRYEGPFPISRTVKVRACATVPGSGLSPIVESVYSERHPVKPGEWTTDISGALEAAASDGKLIAVLSANYNGCYYSQILEPIARGDEFTAWAAANGVYLVSADTGRDPDASAAMSKFSSLYSQTALRTTLNGYIYYPTFVLTTPGAPSTCAGAFLARTGYAEENGDAYDYTGTIASLVKCFSAALGETPLDAPAVTMSGSGSSRSVTVQNPNGTGVVYYTLDGSAPTPTNGIRYTSPVSVASAGGKFLAAVWPTSGTGVSSPVVMQGFLSVADILGTEGIVWQNDASLPWTESSAGWIQGGKDLSLTTGTKTSTLTATVSGAGKLVFDYGVASRGSLANVTLKVNGSTVETWYSAKSGSYVYEVTATGTTRFEWVYTYPYYDSYSGQYGRIGNVKWVHWPTHPVGVSASDGTYSNGVFVTWNEVPGATTYRLYRCANETFLNPVLVRETEKTFGWDFGAEAGRTYWYAVSAINTFGESVRSGPVSGWRSAPLEIVDETLPTAFKAVAYSHRMTARGGKSPYVWKEMPLGEGYEERREASSFSLTGTAKGWNSDDQAWELSLPFEFPFYGKAYSKAYVSSNGTITFDNSFSGYTESETTLKQHAMIAVFWDDLKTTDGDIYVKTSQDSVTVRWAGVAYSGGGAVNFAVTLKADGTIRLQYGSGNAAKGMIGISAGNGLPHLMAKANLTGNMANAQDIVFVPDGLPEEFRLDADGTLSGTPTKTGTYWLRIGVTDVKGDTVAKTYSLTVAESFFTVTFDLGEHGRRIGGGELSQRVCGGDAALAPTVEAETGWRFTGWSTSFSDVRGNVTVRALYEAYSLSRAVDGGDLTFTTGGESPWTVDFDQHTVGESCLRSGRIGDSAVSWVETTVSGSGTLTFWWKTSSEIYKTTPVDVVSFQLDGGEYACLGGQTDWAQVTVQVSGVGPHVLRWTYEKDMSDSAGEDCAWLDGVTWSVGVALGEATVPASVTGGKAITVTGTWVTDHLVKEFGSDRATSFVSKFGSDFTKALLKTTGKKSADGQTELCVWQDYVAGTDPTDPESKFTAVITIENGVPKVKWEPDLNEDGTKSIRSYTTYGMKALGGEWKDQSKVPAAEKSDYKFFKVSVEMP